MDKSESHYSVFRRYIHVPAWGTQIVICVLLSVALRLVAAVPGDCSGDSDCGVNSQCVNQTCACRGELNLHTNLKDCVNGSCKSPDCVSCVHGTCQRCVHFIDKSSRECLHTCTGKAEMIYSGDVQGSVCTQSDGADDLSDIIIGIVAGVSAGVLLCVILGLCLHFHLKRKRGQVNLQSRHINSEPMEMGHVRKIPVFENKGFIIHPEPPTVNKTAYLEEVEHMKPSAQMLLDLLNQIRKRVRAMEPTDARIPTYKGVIHQLCRVLVMLNKKDPGSSVPADGLSLLEWARQMLQDYVETRQSLEEGDLEEETSQRYPPATPETTSTSLPPSEQTPYPAFSAREDPPFNPVYASPVDSLERTSHHTPNTISRSSYPNNSQPHTFAKLPPRPGHYSSVPVPYTETVTPNGVSRVGRGVPVSSPTVPAEDSGGSGESHGVRSAYKQYPTTRPVISHNPSGPPVTNKGGNPEIYAPASSYSDYAQPKVSTFSGGVPRSLSSDTPSHCSSDSDDPMPDGLPFDLEDATEPVEV